MKLKDVNNYQLQVRPFSSLKLRHNSEHNEVCLYIIVKLLYNYLGLSLLCYLLFCSTILLFLLMHSFLKHYIFAYLPLLTSLLYIHFSVIQLAVILEFTKSYWICQP